MQSCSAVGVSLRAMFQRFSFEDDGCVQIHYCPLKVVAIPETRGKVVQRG